MFGLHPLVCHLICLVSCLLIAPSRGGPRPLRVRRTRLCCCSPLLSTALHESHSLRSIASRSPLSSDASHVTRSLITVRRALIGALHRSIESISALCAARRRADAAARRHLPLRKGLHRVRCGGLVRQRLARRQHRAARQTCGAPAARLRPVRSTRVQARRLHLSPRLRAPRWLLRRYAQHSTHYTPLALLFHWWALVMSVGEAQSQT